MLAEQLLTASTASDMHYHPTHRPPPFTVQTHPSWGPSPPNYALTTSYSTSVPRRYQTSPGVWSDGTSTVLSAVLPQVQALLKEGRSSLQLPPVSSDVIFTLAALEVFYKPSDPAHWLFWSDEKKNQTATRVNRISLHQPPLIRSNVAWNGIPEYLAILASHHGSTWRPLYEKQPWYTTLVPPKAAAQSKVLNLRKRKAAPGAFREPSKSPGHEDAEDVEEPPIKRSKVKRTGSPAKRASQITRTQPSQEDTIPQKSQPSPTSSTSSLPPANLPLITPPSITVLLPDTTSPNADLSPRAGKRRKAGPPSRYPASIQSREPSTTPVDSLLLASASTSQSRNRSSSQDSAETVVAPEPRRSTSVSSASTTVEPSNSKKRKADVAMDIDIGGKIADDMDANSDVSVDSDGMVTRARASKGRSDESKVDQFLDEPIEVVPTSRAVKARKVAPSRAKGKKTVKA
ncbi:hypothetical protein BDQ12DRAFT_673648 [Crucibulum laeve]|uniref:Uncharacterized protein n=1 Tax=Crucibulum laeve TaxID=68775 RepID=A0A5C3MHD5_9AGAR|nr:hypothetical protein BDQ12DRAFT_673648 [Crucibulum laeve]